jgi:PKD repeat protein
MKKSFLLITALVITMITNAATITVINTSDSGPGSLRQAAANATSGDIIDFSPSLLSGGNATILLTSGEINFGNKAITINGSLTTSATDTLFISGNNSSRIFYFDGAGKVVLDGVVLIDGNGVGLNSGTGGAVNYREGTDTLHIRNAIIKNNSAAKGGGVSSSSISSSSFVTVSNSTFSGNVATGAGGGIHSEAELNSSVTVSYSTFSADTAQVGGGVYSTSVSGSSFVTINNSTFSGNQVDFDGGGVLSISSSSSSIVTVSNSTFIGNTFTTSGGAGGGIFSSTPFPQVSSVVVGSSIMFNSDVMSNYTNTIVSNGYNILELTFYTGTVGTDQTGVTQPQLNLQPLAYNGGATQTMLPGAGSFVIDMGNPNDLSNAQNGPITGGIRDVGAAEAGFQCPTIANQNVLATETTVCTTNTGTSITTGSSETEIHYILRNDANDTLVDGPTEGTGSGLSFNTGVISTTTSYNVYAGINASGSALDFEGIDDYVSIQDNPDLNFGTGDFTVEFWMNTTLTDVQNDALIAKTDGALLKLWLGRSGDKAGFNITTGNQLTSLTSINDGAWHHIAGVRTAGTLQLYVDGILEASETGRTGDVSSSYDFIIGNYAGAFFYGGKVDNLGIWNVARSATEIQNSSNMTALFPEIENDLVAYYDFEDGSGTTLTDVTGNNHDGVLTLMDSSTVWVASSVKSIKCGEEMANTVTVSLAAPTTATDVITACYSYTWIDGVFYTSSNTTATHTLVNAAGCDSTVTLNLTIENSTISTNYTNSINELLVSFTNTSVVTNGPTPTYYWDFGDGNTSTQENPNHSFAASGTYSVCFTVSNLCTNETLCAPVTVCSTSSSTDQISACNSYTWIDGNNYTSTNNSATHTLTNAGGCDSIVTLNLTINNSNIGIDVITACDSYSWIDGNNYTSTNNTATHTLTNAGGCDSIVTLNLTIINSSTGTDLQTACDSYTWIDGNTYSSSSNTATYLTTNAAGCDSTITLDLTINTVNTAISNSELTITADESAATYQWIDCGNNNDPINGETNQSYTATANGDYAVIVTMNGCSDTSACESITAVGLNDLFSQQSIVVYPNPSKDYFTIESDWLSSTNSVQVVSIEGKLMYENRVENKTKLELNAIDWNPGVYFLKLKTDKGNAIIKLIKE